MNASLPLLLLVLACVAFALRYLLWLQTGNRYTRYWYAEGVVPALQPANRKVFNYLPQSIKMQVRYVDSPQFLFGFSLAESPHVSFRHENALKRYIDGVSTNLRYTGDIRRSSA